MSFVARAVSSQPAVEQPNCMVLTKPVAPPGQALSTTVIYEQTNATKTNKERTPVKISRTRCGRASSAAEQRGLSGAYRRTCRAALTDRYALPASSEARRLPPHPTSARDTEFLMRLAAAAAAAAAQAWQPAASVCANSSPSARRSPACAGLHRGCLFAS